MTVYIVQKLNWKYDDTFYVHLDDETLKAFVLREDAEEYRRILERKHIVTPLRRGIRRWYSHTFGDDGYGNTTFIGVDGRSDRPNALYEILEVEVEP